MAKKNITIDDLAVMVQKGFNETAKKVDIDKRFDAVEKRLEKIEDIFIKRHDDEIKYLKERVNKLEDALAIE